MTVKSQQPLRHILKMAAPFRVVFLVFIASFFVIGIYDMLSNFEENGCEMTYMFEWPKYMVRILLFHFLSVLIFVQVTTDKNALIYRSSEPSPPPGGTLMKTYEG